MLVEAARLQAEEETNLRHTAVEVVVPEVAGVEDSTCA